MCIIPPKFLNLKRNCSTWLVELHAIREVDDENLMVRPNSTRGPYLSVFETRQKIKHDEL
jgi:hypothetical protein